jgi:CDP-diacylglycerol---glycerol-3-phosphate 3-phosphatidyltransferase
MNLANKLTLSRIFLIPLMLIFTIDIIPWQQQTLILDISNSQLVFSIIFIVASITDFLDGYIARKTQTITTFGKFLDPIADKALVVTAMVYLVSIGSFSVWIVSLIVLREFLVSGVRLVAVEKQKVIAASRLGKQKTLWTIVTLLFYLFNLSQFSQVLGTILIAFMFFLTMISGLEYIYKNKALLLENK